MPLDVTEEKSIQVSTLKPQPAWAFMYCTSHGKLAEGDYMQAAAKSVSEKFEHVHLLLNVAGILHVPGELSPGNPCLSVSCTCCRLLQSHAHSQAAWSSVDAVLSHSS